jgi:hypothetical protein
VLSVERGAICGRRRAGSSEHGPIRKERPGHGAEGQVSSTKQFVPGASAKRCVRSDPQAAQGGKHRERSNPGAMRKAKCRARSNSRPVRGARSRAWSNPARTPRRKVLSTERSARSNPRGSIGPQGPIDPQGQIRDQHRAGNAGNGAIREGRRRPSIESGAIRERCEALKCCSTAYAASNAGARCQPRSNPCIASGASVEQGAIPDRCKVRMFGSNL